MPLGRTRQLSISPGMTPDMLRLINEQRSINKDLDRRKPVTSPTVFNNDAQRPPAVKNPRRIIFVRQADGSFRGQYSDGSAWQTFLATAVSFATPTITHGTTYSAGSAVTTIRSDAQLKYPSALMSAANSATLTLTDDGTDTTLTGSLGILKFSTPGNKMQLDSWTSAAGVPPTVGVVLAFQASTALLGTTLTDGVNAQVTLNDASTHSGTLRGAFISSATSGSVGATYSAFTVKGVEISITQVTHTTNTHTYAERNGLNISIGAALQSGSGAVTVTDTYGMRISGYPTIGTGGTQTNATTARLQFPTIGATIRRGCWVDPSATSNIGTETANTEGFYCGALPRGTGQRTSYYALGATTGTPTTVVGFYAAAHGVGTNKWSFFANDPSTFAGITMTDATDVVLGTGTGTKLGTGTTQKLGFWNAAPVVQQTAAGVVLGFTANVTANAVFDASTFTGNIGATAYTIGDIVAALKTEGLIKS